MSERHKMITWTNADLQSVGSCAIHLEPIAQEMFMKGITSTHLNSKPYQPGNNEQLMFKFSLY